MLVPRLHSLTNFKGVGLSFQKRDACSAASRSSSQCLPPMVRGKELLSWRMRAIEAAGYSA